MSDNRFPAGRWIAAALAMFGLAAVFYQLVVDNMPKGEVRKIDGYTPWSAETSSPRKPCRSRTADASSRFPPMRDSPCSACTARAR